MGFLALKKIQAGLETTRGTPVAATRPIYGTMTIQREQSNRYAEEQRGSFVKYFRANQKLIDAGFKLDADLTFEDLPYFAELFMQAASAPTAAGSTAFSWAFSPDTVSDLIKSRTFNAGDDSVAWQGGFGVVDQAEFTLDLNDAVKMALTGFVQDWVPATGGFLATPFAGFAGGLTDRTVESVMGYQSRLMIDAAGAIGTTWVKGRHISSKWGYHLNNKKLPFGDNLKYTLQKLGRGLRDVSANIVFEALDDQHFADLFNKVEKAVRIQLIGSPIAASTYGALNGAVAFGTTISALTTTALTAAIAGGSVIYVNGQAFTVSPAGAALNALSIPILTDTVSVPGGLLNAATVAAAKFVNFDFWGYWDAFAVGARDTDTTFEMKLQGVYDGTQTVDHKITVYNQNNLAAGIS